MGHVNCQPKSYWIGLFAEQGFLFDVAMTESWQNAYAEKPIAPWFQKNLMIFHVQKSSSS